MKRLTLTALAVLAAAVAAPAFAQSSVTLYGRLNTTVENQKTNGAASLWAVNNNSSRIGFKGTEDLGGGLKASFNLEHGFSSDTGTAASTFWGRAAFVQLAGAFGQLRLGNFTPESYYATADYISMHNHDTGSSSDALYDVTTYRSSNKVGYYTPSLLGGWVLHAAVSAGEGQGTNKRLYDLAANYVSGPLHVGFGMSDHGNKYDQWAVRVMYEMGALTVGGYFQKSNNLGVKTEAQRLAAMYTVGASEFHVNVGKSSNGEQFTLGYNYNLSKRTKLYGYYTDRDTNTSVAHSGEFSSFAVGVRHNF